MELFAGAGGMALGLSLAGFKHRALVELDTDACATLLENQSRCVADMSNWPIYPCDVKQFRFDGIPEGIELLAAGVPCQPFSIGGKHKGHRDKRNLFPETVSAIRKLKPKAILIENVRGLARSSFAEYFSYIQLMLMYPELFRRASEDWPEHRARLEKYHTRGKHFGLFYRVVTRVLNAADYGVPQKRWRVFMVGFRCDIGKRWSFPEATHSLESLTHSQYVTGEYWERNGVPKRKIPEPSEATRARLNSGAKLDNKLKPWATVREAIADLPAPLKERASEEPGLTHFAIPGARRYAGHTGSGLDEPAKTIKAGDHGVPGGENMIALPEGSVRYFTIRESARLQTFPDNFVFPCSWTESMRQIGNAVPVRLAQCLGESIKKKLQTASA